MDESATIKSAAPRGRIEAGTLAWHEGRSYQIKEVIDLATVTAIDLESHTTRVLPLAELEAESEAPTGIRTRALDGLSEEEKKVARERFEVIRPLLEMPRYGRKDVEARAEETGYSYRNLYRMLAKYRATGDITSLVVGKRGWRKDTTRLAADAEEVITEVIENYYLTPLRPGQRATVKEVKGRCEKRGIKAPGTSTVLARLEKIDEKEKLERRGQPDKARRRFNPATEHFPNADFPLAVVQIDHTEVDVILVDDEHRLPIGRPWITLAIDVYSRVIMGYYLSFDAPSILSVGMCMTHAILPKEEWLRRHGIDAEWPVWGMPEGFHSDNAGEFRSESIADSCLKHGINIEFRPVGRPEYGAHIERLIGNVAHQLKGIPGSTFSSINERGETKPEESAALTLSEFEKWLLTWICLDYHQRKHSGINTTPLARLRHGLLGDNRTPGRGVPERPENPDDIVRDFLPGFRRTVQREGVELESQQYFDEPLRRWIQARDPEDRTKTRRFTFRRDPRDISVLWFFDPELEEYFKIPCTDRAMPAVSIWEYKRARAYLAAQGIAEVNPANLIRAFEEMRQIEEQAAAKTKQAKTARRNRQRRKDHAQAVTPASPPESPPAHETIPETAFSDGPIEPFETIR